MLSYSHWQITGILAVIAHDWKHRCNESKTRAMLMHIGAVCTHVPYGIGKRQFWPCVNVCAHVCENAKLCARLKSAQRRAGWKRLCTFCLSAFRRAVVRHGNTICWAWGRWKTMCCYDDCKSALKRNTQELVVGMQGAENRGLQVRVK